MIFHRSKLVLKSSSYYAGIKDNSSPFYVNLVRGHEILYGAGIRVLKNEVFIWGLAKKLYPQKLYVAECSNKVGLPQIASPF